MYLSHWQRTVVFNALPCLRNKSNSTYYLKDLIPNPKNIDFWNKQVDLIYKLLKIR